MSTPPPLTRVIVLGGGPDAEREVSLDSSGAVARALEKTGRFDVRLHEIERLDIDQLGQIDGDVLFPVLHGGWGEGGPLQDLLEADGRPFVGSGSDTARLAMDKAATKILCAELGIPTPAMRIADLRDVACPFPLPVIAKPVHEGSTIGLHLCRTAPDWSDACAAMRADAAMGSGRVFMVERCVVGREITIGLLDGEPLPAIEITPADGLYDYDAKYARNDTTYTVDPTLPAPALGAMRDDAVRLCERLGVRHLARADFMLDDADIPWMLEVNTMPGFTSHSLVPMSAASIGLALPDLCERLVSLALRDGRTPTPPTPPHTPPTEGQH